MGEPFEKRQPMRIWKKPWDIAQYHFTVSDNAAVMFSDMQIPNDIFQRILSFLTWRELLGVKRVAKSWRDSANACLASYTKLHIGKFEFPPKLEDTELEVLLRAMPSLTHLCVDWRLDGEKLDIDIISRHCRRLVHVDLTRFRLDAWSLEQLCAACPSLEAVKLPRKCDNACVEVVLRSLSHLRSIDLACTRITGGFLKQPPYNSVTKLVLSGCSSLELKQLEQDGGPKHSSSWPQVRELDLSSTLVTTADVARVFKQFPNLKVVSFANCNKMDSSSMLQMAVYAGLRDLDLSGVSPLQASDLFTMLIGCGKLERLVLSGCEIQEASRLSPIDRLSADLGLRELNVSAVRCQDGFSLATIIDCSPGLQCLIAPDFHPMELAACLQCLKKCPGLRELALSRPGTDASGKTVDSSLLTSFLMTCRKLERLLLAECHIVKSEDLHQLPLCPNLRELELSHSAGVVASALARGLANCPRLERLSVAGHEAPIEHLVPSTGLPNLSYLDVSESGLTNNSVRRLQALFPRLHTLDMMGCKDVKAGSLVAYLPRMQQLRFLDLRDVPTVTEALLDRLRGCRLSRLRLNDVSLKEGAIFNTKGVAELALQCQSLDMVWMEGHQYYFRETRDAIKQQQPRNRSLVICVIKENLGSSEYYSMMGPQQGPLWIADVGDVNWKKS